MSNRMPRRRRRVLNTQQKSAVKRLIAGTKEKKNVEVHAIGDFSGTSTIGPIQLSTIAAGDRETDRDGNKCELRRLQGEVTLQLEPYNPGVKTQKQTFVRIILFKWNNPTAPTGPDLLNNVFRPIEDQFYEKHNGFIIMDKLVVVDNFAKGALRLSLNKVKNIRGTECTYTSNLAASISKGQIYVLIQNQGTEADLTYSYGTRLWFVDK